MRAHLLLPFLLPILAACSGGTTVVETNYDCQGSLDDFLYAADDNGDGVVDSDEFNGAFQSAMDEVTPDGQLDRNELHKYVCSKVKQEDNYIGQQLTQ